MSRPVLLPGLTALWRGPRTLQLGLQPQAIILDLPNPAAAGLLDLLDGARTESGVLAAAGRRGIGEKDARALLDTLRRYGLVVSAHTLLPRGLAEPARARIVGEAAALALRRRDRADPDPATPAQILARRAAARIRVTGRGRLGLPVAVALALAGIGHVDPALAGTVEAGELMAGDPVDGPPRPRAAVAAHTIARLAPGTRVTPLPRRQDATFVVQVGATPGPATLHALAYRGVPHLAVAVRDGTALVGPLVPPGGAPCLNCVDLHRTDRDPAWPMLAAQLATPDARPGRGPVAEVCDTATALAATAYTVDEVLRYLDGDLPRTLGATVELRGAGEARRRSWAPHPRCHCHHVRRPARPGRSAHRSGSAARSVSGVRSRQVPPEPMDAVPTSQPPECVRIES
jgi:bacteriocin biosynthesis cyclodehydratase domain-containing protein